MAQRARRDGASGDGGDEVQPPDAPADNDPPAPRTSRRGRSRSGRARAADDGELPSYTVGDAPASAPAAAPRAVSQAARHRATFDEARLDPDVTRLVTRLARAGHEAYLVGGCVRDLLLGKAPKDFDVATSARPEDVRAIFRNSRIIGRRFRLVHVMFSNRKVIEVATFRRNPQGEAEQARDEDLLIRSDNAFGTIEEDARRRDFTINALFYDVEDGTILDFCGGMPDIERRAVRTIGEPVTRFLEDPVRLLRAVKFAAKLDLGIDPDVVDAMLATRDQLRLAAKPRLFEEILRLMRGGASRRAMFLAWETGLLHVLLPELAVLLDDVGDDAAPATRVFRLLGELDHRTHQLAAPLDDVILFTVLLFEPLLEACEGEGDRVAAAMEFCQPILERLAVPRRVADGVRRIVALTPKLLSGRSAKARESEHYQAALTVLELHLAARRDKKALARLQGREPLPPARQTLSSGVRGVRPSAPLAWTCPSLPRISRFAPRSVISWAPRCRRTSPRRPPSTATSRCTRSWSGTACCSRRAGSRPAGPSSTAAPA